MQRLKMKKTIFILFILLIPFVLADYQCEIFDLHKTNQFRTGFKVNKNTLAYEGNNFPIDLSSLNNKRDFIKIKRNQFEIYCKLKGKKNDRVNIYNDIKYWSYFFTGSTQSKKNQIINLETRLTKLEKSK